MPAAYWKIKIDQGESWSLLLRLKNPATDDDPPTPLDLTGYDVRMQVRESITSPSPLLSLTIGSGITVDAAEGEIRLAVADTVTAAWAWRYGVYDLEIESPGGDTTRLLKGEVEVSAEVTR